MRTIRSAAAVALVVIAVLGGGLLALATYSAERELSVGRIELSVQPFHHGALDLYVPLVDWGASARCGCPRGCPWMCGLWTGRPLSASRAGSSRT